MKTAEIVNEHGLPRYGGRNITSPKYIFRVTLWLETLVVLCAEYKMIISPLVLNNHFIVFMRLWYLKGFLREIRFYEIGPGEDAGFKRNDAVQDQHVVLQTL
jgi:hypothetical protein